MLGWQLLLKHGVITFLPEFRSGSLIAILIDCVLGFISLVLLVSLRLLSFELTGAKVARLGLLNSTTRHLLINCAKMAAAQERLIAVNFVYFLQ